MSAGAAPQPPATPRTERSRPARAAWLIVGIAIVVLKTVVLSDLSHLGRVAFCIVLAVGGVTAFWHGRVITTWFFVALIVPIAVGVHPFGTAALIALALLLVLTALSYALSLYLRARDARDPTFRSGGSADGDPQPQPVDQRRIGLG